MQDRLNILLVEDNKAISDVYKQFFEGDGNVVVCAFDGDEAVKILDENPSFAFDLLFTDIDLVGDPTKGADKSGIAFACYAHKIVPQVPVVGHSAYFDNDDITPDERACFDEWFPKGIKTAEREKMFDLAIELGKKRRKERMSNPTERGDPVTQDPLNVPVEEGEYAKLGYTKEVVSPNSSNGFTTPFSVWQRESEDGCELEVVGCPALLAWGEQDKDAYEHLVAFIKSNKDLAYLPEDKLSGSSSLIARFVRDVFAISGDK